MPTEESPDGGGAAVELADGLISLTREQFDELAAGYAPSLVLPRTFGGHLVDGDTLADLVYSTGMLRAAGVETVGGVAAEGLIHETLARIHGPSTNPFSAYRIAETLAAVGGMGGVADADRANVDAACNAADWAELLDHGLPRNYAVVIARGLLARRSLGLEVDEASWEELLARATDLLSSAEIPGFIDDSNDGEGRYDIYSADVHLFAAPLAPFLGDVWLDGLRAVIGLAEKIGASNGAAFTWGRSTGVLSVCMTIELGAIALQRDLTDRRDFWAHRIHLATQALRGWFERGVINAHQHRSPYAYRGPARRLQLTFDVLGKTAQAALWLRGTDPPPLVVVPPPPEDIDELVSFRPDGRAGVWTFASRQAAFVMAFTGTVRTDYLAAPQRPGLFEVPVDSPLATGVPVVWRRGDRFSTGGLPDAIDHDGPGELTARWETAEFRATDHADKTFAGTRRVHLRVDGRELRGEETLTFEVPPDAVGVQFAERAGRPLTVAVTTDHPHTLDRVDVDGIKDHRSFWGELPVLHQLDLEPATSIRFRWSVRPKLRVMSTAHGHPYHDGLYRYLSDDVADQRVPLHLLGNRPALVDRLRDVDQFHLHWPEWLTGVNLTLTEGVIAALDEADVRIVWTMHNSKAHDMEGSEPLYEAWAAVTDVVLHHSHWGQEQTLARYRFRDDARHLVLPHLHWGDVLTEAAPPSRADAERSLGLEPAGPGHGTLRLGIVGAPRAEKDVQLALDAFAASARSDLRLFVSSLADEVVPDDPRIVARPYEFGPPADYVAQIRCLDVIVMPFRSTGMLTTGTVGDAIAHGVPCIVSDWPYLHEALGEVGLAYDGTGEGLTALLDGLDTAALDRARSALDARRAETEPSSLARRFLAELDELGTAKL